MSKSDSLSIIVAGDFIPPDTNEELFSNRLKEFLGKKDFSIANLETPLTTDSSAIDKNGNNFKRHPESIKHVVNGCFDAVTISNNHIRDFGDQGIAETIRVCNTHNIKVVGAGKNLENARNPLRVVLKGRRISFLNYSEKEFNTATPERAGSNPFDPINAFNDIIKEKRVSDFVIVIYHGGIENQHYPTEEMIDSFKFMIEVGADVVASHHSHAYSGQISHKNRPIIFGLGNFLAPTKRVNKRSWRTGLISILNLSSDKISSELIPIGMSETFTGVDLLDLADAKDVLNKVSKISENICNEQYMKNYWIERDTLDSKYYFLLLKSNSRIEYKLRKHIPFSFMGIPRISKYKRNILVNLFRCDSHRDRIIRILEENL